MIDQTYLHRGLSALARAWQANSMAGHLGAAVVAGYCFADSHPDLDARVVSGIRGELDRVIAGEELWFDPDKVGVTVAALFEPFPVPAAEQQPADAVVSALSENINALRQSGHNVIFAAIAVRALQENPEYATPEIVSGICKLIEAFSGQHPGRVYFGEERGWVTGDQVDLPEDDRPPYAGEGEIAEAVAQVLVETAHEHRQGCGGLWHIINHTAALIDLSRLGYDDLARSGYAAHRHHIRLWRALPDLTDELGPMERAEHDPLTPDYWTCGPLRRDRALLTHRIKTIYGFRTVVECIEGDAARNQAEEAFLYLMD